MKKHFKYEKLSKKMKDEIKNYCTYLEENNIHLDLENAMEKWFDEKFDDWFIEHIDSHNTGEKRKSVRFDIELPVTVAEILIESSGDVSDSKEIKGKVVNVSRRGLYFRSREHIPVSSIIRIFVGLSKVDPELSAVEALAVVVRSEHIDKKRYGIGVTFSSISDNNKSHMDIFIFKNFAQHFYTA